MKILALLLVSATALAAPLDAATTRAYKHAQDLYDAGKFDEAAAEFDALLQSHPTLWVLKYSTAESYRRQFVRDHGFANAKKALALYQQLVDETPASWEFHELSSQYAFDLGQKIAVEDLRTAQPVEAAKPKTELMITTHTVGATISIDGASATASSAIEVAPGTHRAHVEAKGFDPQDVDAVAIEGRLITTTIDLVERFGAIVVHAPRDAEVTVDGRALASERIGVPRGSHFVAVTRRGAYPKTLQVFVDRGEVYRYEMPLQDTNQRRASYWVAGGAGVLLLAGGISSLLALSAEHRAQDYDAKLAGGTNLTAAELADENNAIMGRDHRNDASYVLYGASAATLAIAALMYFVDRPHVDAPSVSVAPSGNGMQVLGRF